ncbi:MAG: Unknown protein, partial [uncultured Thiotrichaceae bacterium]
VVERAIAAAKAIVCNFMVVLRSVEAVMS